MALDDLQAVIEKLRDTTQSQHDYISRHETRTRQVLIDPLLEILGWVVSDPNLVELEYSAGGGRADYALKSNEKVVAVIEAKALGKPLEQKELEQVLQYAVGRGIPYMGVTNGDEWRMYDVFEAKPIEEKVIMQFRLTGTPTHEVALKSLLMWRPNLASGSGPTAANAPKLCVANENDAKPATEDFAQQSVTPDATQSENAGVVGQSLGDEWLTLEAVGFQTHDPWPKELILPGGEPVVCKNYRTVWVNLANWLFKTSPTKWAEYFGEFVGASQDDLPNHSSPRQLSNEYWLRTNYSTRAHGKNIKGAVEYFGVDLRSIRIKFN